MSLNFHLQDASELPLQEVPWSVCFPLTISLCVTSTHWLIVSSETQKVLAPSCLLPSGSRCPVQNRCSQNDCDERASAQLEEWCVHPPFVFHGHILSPRRHSPVRHLYCELDQRHPPWAGKLQKATALLEARPGLTATASLTRAGSKSPRLAALVTPTAGAQPCGAAWHPPASPVTATLVPAGQRSSSVAAFRSSCDSPDLSSSQESRFSKPRIWR